MNVMKSLLLRTAFFLLMTLFVVTIAMAVWAG
jgi:hypothetical protein